MLKVLVEIFWKILKFCVCNLQISVMEIRNDQQVFFSAIG